jgi:Cu/Ag efflux protein CusF
MTIRIGPLFTLLAACLLSAPVRAQEPKTSVREFISLSGTVERIDQFGRILTLKAGGVEQGVYVPPEIKLFSQLKAGDQVTARVRESVIVSTRPGLKPQVTTDTTADAAKKRGTAADAQLLQQLKAVVTIESIDPQTRLVTYKTADNRRIVRAVLDPRLLDDLKPGDTIEVTLTRERVVELQRQR